MAAIGDLFDFAVITIFAREFLEGSIIIGEYRTLIIRGGDALAPGVTRKQALSEVTLAAIVASAFALFVLACIAIPLAMLATNFNAHTAHIIEGVSKMVAAVCLLELSLKLPKILGVYTSHNVTKNDFSARSSNELTIRSIRFNVAWNIWREVAECGVFLLPAFLSGSGLKEVPLSALVGSAIGLLCGMGIYYANKTIGNRNHLCIFAVLLLVALSAGLFSGGSHLLEKELRPTKEIWRLTDKVWHADRLPMTVLKPFGYDDSRTVLQIVTYWSWLLLSGLLHLCKYLMSPKKPSTVMNDTDEEQGDESSSSDGKRDLHGLEETLPSNEDMLSAKL